MDIETIRKLRVDLKDGDALKKIPVDPLKKYVEGSGWELLATFKDYFIYKHPKPVDILDLLEVDNEAKEGYYQVLIPRHNKFDDYGLRMYQAIRILEKTDPGNRTQIQILEFIMGDT